ncbi:MAG TPA: beta-L-arabinofuranosidase domain-containing protein, partial [Rhodothermales bacterium]
NIYWNHRMFLLHGDSRYIDVLERTLYNGMLSGVSLDGNTFFYPNPLESDGQHAFNHGSATRSPWFAASCCPTNVARFIPSVPDYLYGHRGDTLYVNLFVASRATVNLDGEPVEIEQRTRYPWDGEIDIQVEPESRRAFVVKLRIPGWATNQPVPTDLYRYVDDAAPGYEIRVNGVRIEAPVERGYAVIFRRWDPNDVIELSLPMPVRRVAADPRVAADSGKVALERGPIVYAAEGIDNGGHVLDLAMPDSVRLEAQHRPDLLGGVTVLTGTAASGNGAAKPFTAIPYYAWSHRGVGEMVVWLNRIPI